MWTRLRHVWLPRTCSLLAITLALALLAAVIATPYFAADQSVLLTLFAHNRGVRGAAVASALGLVVTARVFFRTTHSAEQRSPRQPPPGTMAGA